MHDGIRAWGWWGGVTLRVLTHDAPEDTPENENTSAQSLERSAKTYARWY